MKFAPCVTHISRHMEPRSRSRKEKKTVDVWELYLLFYIWETLNGQRKMRDYVKVRQGSETET